MWAFTVKATPSSDVTGVIMGKDEAGSGETSSHNVVIEGDGGCQLDQGNVVTGEGTLAHLGPLYTLSTRVIISNV